MHGIIHLIDWIIAICSMPPAICAATISGQIVTLNGSSHHGVRLSPGRLSNVGLSLFSNRNVEIPIPVVVW